MAACPTSSADRNARAFKNEEGYTLAMISKNRLAKHYSKRQSNHQDPQRTIVFATRSMNKGGEEREDEMGSWLDGAGVL
jgi:hypothetical protein